MELAAYLDILARNPKYKILELLLYTRYQVSRTWYVRKYIRVRANPKYQILELLFYIRYLVQVSRTWYVRKYIPVRALRSPCRGTWYGEYQVPVRGINTGHP